MAVAAPEASRLLAQVPPHLRALLLANGLPVEQLARLAAVRPWPSARHLAATLAWLVAAPVLGIWLPTPLAWLVIALVNLHAFNNLATLVHASDHNILFVGARLNEAWGGLCGACLGYSRRGHQATHLEHHLYLNTSRDPDRVWGTPDESARQVLGLALRDLLFVSALGRFSEYWRADVRVGTRARQSSYAALGSFGGSLGSVAFVAAVQAAILTLYWVTLGPLHYVGLYVLVLATIYPALIRIRTFTEHAFDAGTRPRTPEEAWVTRNARGTWLERFIFGPPDTATHFEHHVLPFVPIPALPEARRLIEAAGLPAPEVSSCLGYLVGRLREERRPEAQARA